MYGIYHAGRVQWSAEIARDIVERCPDDVATMRQLVAIESLEARGQQYANQDFDVLSAALDYLGTAGRAVP